MKRMLAILFMPLILCSLLSGCVFVPVIDFGNNGDMEPIDDLTDMEMYQYLSRAITEESSLEEMLLAFREMCNIEKNTLTDMYLYEVYSYEQDGKKYLNCHLARQMDTYSIYGYIQVHLEITYLLDDDLAGLRCSTWLEGDPAEFIRHIQESAPYQAFSPKPIHAWSVDISYTD